MNKRPRVLLVERSTWHSSLKDLLESSCDVEKVTDTESGFKIATKGGFDLIITEEAFGFGRPGSLFSNDLKNMMTKPPKIILLSDWAEPVPHKADKFFLKPFPPEIILQAIRQMISSAEASA